MDRKNVFWAFDVLSGPYYWLSLDRRFCYALWTIQPVYYPVLAIIAIPVNLMTIVILSRGKCGLSKGVTRYLIAMAASDLLIVTLDLILRHIPIAYRTSVPLLYSRRVCNIHAILLYAVTDCSVWFTVTFTFDRFVAICCQKLKTTHCTERRALLVLAVVSLLSCLKNVFWYFMLTGEYGLNNMGLSFCVQGVRSLLSPVWAAIAFFHYLLTPVVPFVLILLLNALTIRHVLVASKARKRLRNPKNDETTKDTEMQSRKKSLNLLLVISGNVILLWAPFTLYIFWNRLYYLGYGPALPPSSIQEIGFMLQMLSCCTNTALYTVTQTKFRDQMKELTKSPFMRIAKCIHF